ncbi:MAG: Gfo/Idh/MocA family oxidoreductase [Candidatus Sumerlaeaceae bacterium]|nr:Gfo/Idh/MocA family oxidoreductase [Candidatus Sumerlaeaceae bacterium]
MKIGFIDHHLNNYHADTFLRILTKELEQKATVVAAYESNPVGDDWCAKNGVARVQSAAEVVAASDAVIVLAPDNVEAHLTLGRVALESGKPCFVDKNLSSSLEDARKIVEIAAAHKTPLMSSSSLRFSVELEELMGRIGNAPIETIFSRGFGRWHGYGVHTIAPALRLIGGNVSRLCDTGTAGASVVTIEDAAGRRALIEVREADNQQEASPWQIGALAAGRYETATITKFAEFYKNLMAQVTAFFATGKSPISVEEQLATVAIETAADESRAAGGKWVDIRL